ncbi:hypothetical protein [Intrasporangium sp. YIM S08009]|uniref:hypothetical protein n=1 Tax=Intrasporangium zincisolvens TaxID=3080018 RepID=UPI002B0562A3|nr:hypothetical protein [Intrasporangium sp. YIM S08009]
MGIQETWRQIRGTATEKVLLNAHEAGGASLRSVYGAGVSDERSAIAAAQRLRHIGLAVQETSIAGELELTGEGHELAEKVLASRKNGPERWDAVQRAMLRFVADKSPGSAFALIGTADGEVDGQPITDSEARMALAFLVERGLMKTLKAMGAPDLRPEVTVNGMYAMHEPNIREYVERGFVSVNNDYSTNTNVTGGTLGAVTGGTGNTATVHQTITTETHKQVLALTRQILDQVPEDVEHARLRAEVESIRDEVESGTGKRETLMAKAGKAALMAGATTAGQQIIGLLAQLGETIGS